MSEKNGQGKRDQFETFVAGFRPHLLALASRWTANHPDAEDLAQDALVRAWRYFDSHRNLKNWLITILRNLVNDWQQKQRLAPWSDLPDEVEDPLPSQNGEIHDDPLARLIPHFAGLKGRLGQLVDAIKEHGNDVDAIARETGWPKHTVRSGMSKLRDRLIEAFGWSEWIRTWRAYLTVGSVSLFDSFPNVLPPYDGFGHRFQFWGGSGDALRDRGTYDIRDFVSNREPLTFIGRYYFMAHELAGIAYEHAALEVQSFTQGDPAVRTNVAMDMLRRAEGVYQSCLDEERGEAADAFVAVRHRVPTVKNKLVHVRKRLASATGAIAGDQEWLNSAHSRPQPQSLIWIIANSCKLSLDDLR